MKAHLVKSLYVEAAHQNLLGTPAQQRLHGHSYRIDILASGTPSEDIGWVVDFAELKGLFRQIEDQLDHAYLNDLPGLEGQPTLRNIENWIMAKIPEPPTWLDGVRVCILGDLAFSPRRMPARPAENLPERIHFTFEAAQSLPHLPGDHPCKVLHGHSYRIEVGAENLDALEPHLKAVYDELDHSNLNDYPGLAQATCERICAWLWERLSRAGTPLTVVVVQETNSSQCLYYGE